MFIIYLLISLILTITSAILLTINPLSLGIVILFTALVLTFNYALIITSWVAFLIFLIYVGGILVIFAYFVALTPNQQTNQIIVIPIVMTLTSLLLISITTKRSLLTPISTIKNINTLYLTENIQLLLILALILLFTIIIVVKLVTNNKGPLRPFINSYV